MVGREEWDVGKIRIDYEDDDEEEDDSSGNSHPLLLQSIDSLGQIKIELCQTAFAVR